MARAHGVNANQVFAWRRRFQQGRQARYCNQDVGLGTSLFSSSVGPSDKAVRDLRSGYRGGLGGGYCDGDGGEVVVAVDVAVVTVVVVATVPVESGL